MRHTIGSGCAAPKLSPGTVSKPCRFVILIPAPPHDPPPPFPQREKVCLEEDRGEKAHNNSRHLLRCWGRWRQITQDDRRISAPGQTAFHKPANASTLPFLSHCGSVSNDPVTQTMCLNMNGYISLLQTEDLRDRACAHLLIFCVSASLLSHPSIHPSDLYQPDLYHCLMSSLC